MLLMIRFWEKSSVNDISLKTAINNRSLKKKNYKKTLLMIGF